MTDQLPALHIVRVSDRALGYLGLGWAAAYLPIHVYWALGGLSTPIGITGEQAGFRAANWGACIVILGAGLTCLSLVRSWGRALPAGLRRGTAWVGGVFGLAHWALCTGYCALRVAGLVRYPSGSDLTEQQLRRFDWANLGYFELWFGVMGVLLIVCARRSRLLAPGGDRRPANRLRGTGTALSLAGIATVLWGVFTFDPWVFAAAGPAILGAGLLTLIVADGRREPKFSFGVSCGLDVTNRRAVSSPVQEQTPDRAEAGIMPVSVAGGTAVVGRGLVPQLVDAGQQTWNSEPRMTTLPVTISVP